MKTSRQETPICPDQPLMCSNHTIYWIGGSPCSGKSSLATQLASKFSWEFYSCDDHFSNHQKRADPLHHPWLHALSGMGWEEIWMRPIEDQVQSVFKIYHEEFNMVMNDLLDLSVERPILAEGAALLPELVFKLLPHPMYAVWLVPSPEFQYHYYPQREWVQGILDQCSQPQTAFQNWMERDASFAGQIAVQAEDLGLNVIYVDGSVGIEDLTERVAKLFGLVVS